MMTVQAEPAEAKIPGLKKVETEISFSKGCTLMYNKRCIMKGLQR